MRLILSLIASAVLLILLPLYAEFIFERIRAGGWRPAAKHIFLALLIASGVFLLGWYGLTTQTAASTKSLPKLEYLNMRALDEEVALRKQQNLLKIQNLEHALHVIKVKFDEAEYAQGKNDSDRALQLYVEIERGSDSNGSFGTFPSACIKNNMAVAYFRKQSDKGFKASSLLFEALRLEPKPPHHLDLIQRNIEALDRYVNQ